jgi:acyl carrier protein
MTRNGFRELIADLLGTTAAQLPDATEKESVGSWSSLVDVQIAAAIQTELGVEPTAEMIEAHTVGQLLDLLEAAGVFH